MRSLALPDFKTPLLHHSQKWIPGRTVKGLTIKPSEDSIWEYQCNLKVGKNYLIKKYHVLRKRLINGTTLILIFVYQNIPKKEAKKWKIYAQHKQVTENWCPK